MTKQPTPHRCRHPPRTREHITTILNKVGASNHTEAVAIALQKQLLKI